MMMKNINAKHKFDVFLSHSSIDKKWVTQLKMDLQTYGLSVWLDKDEIRPGNLFAQELESALENCKAVALVVSPEAVKSGWVEEEYYRTLSLTKNKDKPVQLIPVILRDANMPGFLEGRNWVDFRDEKQYSQSVWRLVWGITGDKPIEIIGLRSSSTKDTKTPEMAIRSPIKINDALSRKIVDSIRSLIALHGLDDDNWAQAISSQYFLVGIAKLLEMTEQQDFVNLLNKFLGSFHHLVTDTLVLESSRILVTPEESRRILQCMIDEDEQDGYYRQSEKTKAENINPALLHDNYLYGLIAQITQSKQYPVLKTIHNLAIDNLLYGKTLSPLDEYGGWYPYRVPWITARILISLKNSNYMERPDAPHIDDVIQKSLESLVRRVYQGNYWRSGVGEWVSQWESTALCLESLDAWDYLDKHSDTIKNIIYYAMSQEKQWMIDPPDFSSELNSNDTLAAVSLICVILKIIKNRENFYAIKIDGDKYSRYLERCIQVITQESDFNSRQFCTIPQIAFYITNTFAG
jgi:hypothetical protein